MGEMKSTSPQSRDEIPLEEAVIVLRDVCDADLPVFFEFQSDPVANQMAAFTSKEPLDWAAFMAKWARLRTDRTIRMKTIVFEGSVAGSVASFERGDPKIQREVTYWIGRKFWGKGIATAALGAFLQEYRVRPLYGCTAKDNVSSLRVLEKCGFVVVGIEKAFANARGAEIEEVILRLAE